jgi:glycogen debranching enzyme
MSSDRYVGLLDRAGEVLRANRRGMWTCPSATLYPHQWLWDSCFTAIGLSRCDPHRAADELRALFRGQWANGMLPHMIFVEGLKDLGSRRIWQSKRHALAPREVATSCITQPPLPAIAAWRVAEALPTSDRAPFLAELFPRLVAYHSWLYAERDLHDRGLVTLIHPWECGLDTTPSWMEQLAAIRLPWWLRTALRLHLARVVRSIRNDTRYLPAAERASDDDGLRMLVLAARAKKHDFDLRRMPPQSSVLIEDLAFNAILSAANHALERIARVLERLLPEELQRHVRRTETALDELWDEPTGQYYSRNAATQELIKIPSIATFLPLYAGQASQTQAAKLIELLGHLNGFWPSYPVPSVPIDAPQFREAGYWQGPSWVNTNWMIIEGLRNYDHGHLAEELRTRTLALVEDAGFSEYFSPLTGAGYGADDFSWTAALTIDLADTRHQRSPATGVHVGPLHGGQTNNLARPNATVREVGKDASQ